jgi:hypothetical protein
VKVVEHDTVEGKGSLQSFHISRGNDMRGSRQELEDNEQHIQPRTKQERGGPSRYGNVHPRGNRASGAARSGGVSVTNVKGAARSPTWKVLRALQSLL